MELLEILFADGVFMGLLVIFVFLGLNGKNKYPEASNESAGEVENDDTTTGHIAL